MKKTTPQVTVKKSMTQIKRELRARGRYKKARRRRREARDRKAVRSQFASGARFWEK